MSDESGKSCNECPLNDLGIFQQKIVDLEHSWGLSPREQVERDMLSGEPPEEASANLDHMYKIEYPTINALMKCVGTRAYKLCLDPESN